MLGCLEALAQNAPTLSRNKGQESINVLAMSRGFCDWVGKVGNTYPSVCAIVAALLPTIYPIAVVGTYSIGELVSNVDNSLGIRAVNLDGRVGDCNCSTTVTMFPGKHRIVKTNII